MNQEQLHGFFAHFRWCNDDSVDLKEVFITSFESTIMTFEPEINTYFILLIFYNVNVPLHLTLIRSLNDKQSQKRDNNLS
jgi:hypothetical protein